MAFTEQDITQALQSLIDPNTGATFASAKAFKNIKVQGADVQLDLELGYPARANGPRWWHWSARPRASWLASVLLL